MAPADGSAAVVVVVGTRLLPVVFRSLLRLSDICINNNYSLISSEYQKWFCNCKIVIQDQWWVKLQLLCYYVT
jgi:hypothetical protein